MAEIELQYSHLYREAGEGVRDAKPEKHPLQNTKTMMLDQAIGICFSDESPA
jgi:hypothetical protein